jgi:hypothetical protein
MRLYNLELTPTNTLFMLDVFVHRLWFKLSGQTDPSSAPYLSGDTFKKLADHVFETAADFNTDLINEGDVIFIKSQDLVTFFTEIHPKIQSRYILISHNGDVNIDQKFKKYIDQKIIHWFAQNVIFSHPKITPLPIGLENLDYYNHGIISLFDRKKKSTKKKQRKILFGFSISTNRKKRQPIHSLLSSLPNCEALSERLNSIEYMDELVKYMFVASPPGNGVDCHRTWEALYSGVVPIVEASTCTESFKKLGLPIWTINSWSDLAKYTSQDLEKKYSLLMNHHQMTPLYLPYWKARIRTMRRK